jgi:hypothetical protein
MARDVDSYILDRWIVGIYIKYKVYMAEKMRLTGEKLRLTEKL